MKKILFIEDENLVNEAYRERFKDKFELLFAFDGKAGFDQAIKLKPDLIVLDIILPGGINGFDVLRDLKQNSITKNIPVIVLTNLDDEDKQAIDSGASACLVKANTTLNKVEENINKFLPQETA